jgi:hypothetical protein
MVEIRALKDVMYSFLTESEGKSPTSKRLKEDGAIFDTIYKYC